MAKRKLSRQQAWRVNKVQQERIDRAGRRDADYDQRLESGELGPEQNGLVIAHYGVQVDIESDGGGKEQGKEQDDAEEIISPRGRFLDAEDSEDSDYEERLARRKFTSNAAVLVMSRSLLRDCL